MTEAEIRKANEKKDKDKAELVKGLAQLINYITLQLDLFANEQSVINAVLASSIGQNLDFLKILPQLHQAGLLERYIRELQSENRLGGIPQSILTYILESPPAQPSAVLVHSRSSAVVAPHSSLCSRCASSTWWHPIAYFFSTLNVLRLSKSQ